MYDRSPLAALLRALGARPISLCSMDACPAHVYADFFDVDPTDPDVVTGDIRDAPLVRKLVAECDYVVHAAALADVAACTREPLAAIDTNIAGTQAVLDTVAASSRIRRSVPLSGG